MQQNKELQPCYEEDEIDLKELLKTILKYKKFILFFTLIITLIAGIYAFTKKPIYEAKSNVRIGFIGNKLIEEPEIISKTLKVFFNVDGKQKTEENATAVVKNITLNKKVTNFLTIETNGISNKFAINKNIEVVNYLKNIYQRKIDQYKINTQNKIENLKQKIKDIKKFKTQNIKNQINVLKKQKIKLIDNKIKILKTQDIVKLQKQIDLMKNIDIKNIDNKIKILRTQDIVKLQKQIDLMKNIDIKNIDNKIKFLQTIQKTNLLDKIKYYTSNLKKYNQAISNLYRNINHGKNPTIDTISSIQMVNYQNLIINAQNHIEDLKLELQKIKEQTIPSLFDKKQKIIEIDLQHNINMIDNIKNITIPDLVKQKQKIIDVSIKNLQTKIDNIKNITIVGLQKEKLNIELDQIRALEHTLNTTIPQNILDIKHQIKQLEFNICDQNLRNSYIVGNIITHNYPIKPKKKLIITVAFVTGLILSIFLVFFMEFVKSIKEEDLEDKKATL